ncbi:hypothetical protein LSH36_667g01041 [Paralvinella palmiformis]|uniref:Phosphotriesterase-related protein n=1 Tax=Paralvinella palmiformis TaxID=53620 RepID=A0AAD9J3E5_9ANNE|nr:hypothetical protein LSH36_667g01041 [Paralvinella palmiformis]
MEKGKIQTVLGPINPDELGLTLCHEHLSMKFDVAFVPPTNPKYKAYEEAELTLENIGWIRQNPLSSKVNINLNDAESAMLYDVHEYKKCGGCTMVENSTIGLNRDMDFVIRVARETGVNVIAGTGYYVADSLPSSLISRSEEDLVKEMASDLTKGVNGSDVKCGVIGEIGCTWPLHG